MTQTTRPDHRDHPHHPLIRAIQGRPQWRPRPFTRAVSRLSAGTRMVAEATNPLEREWHLVSARALAGDDPIWVVLGDSISQGLGASSLGRSWVARIAGALHTAGRPVGIVNLSRSGARSHHVREEQLALFELLDRTPALVSCGVGSNDLMRNPIPTAVAARVTAVVRELPEQAVVSTLPAPSVSPSGRFVNRAVRRAAEDQGVRVADVVPHLVRPTKGLAADRFHPSDAGYEAWVRAYAEVLDLDPATVPDEWEPPRA